MKGLLDFLAGPWKWYEVVMAVFLFFALAFLVFLLTRDLTPLEPSSLA